MDEGKTNYFYDYVSEDKSIFNKKIVCIEANDIHIEDIKKRYQKFEDVVVYNIGIVAAKDKNTERFYYCEKDAPDFQVSSINKDHVLKHYPNEKILSKVINCVEINTLLEKFKDHQIQYLKLDIEGIDEEVITAIDLKKFEILNISIEKIHFKEKFKTIFFLLKNFYIPNYEIHNLSRFDVFFSRKDKNIANVLLVLKFVLYLFLERVFVRIYSLSFKFIRKFEI